MSLKKFIFFFVELDGRCRQVVNGVVTSLTQPKQLSQAPDGNQEIAIGWERSQTYHGNVRMFALPFGYVMEAATILRNDFYKFNLDRVLFLSVKQLTYEYTTTTFKEYYKQVYKGQLDWASADDDQGNHRFNIGLLEAGLQKLMKANESTEYEILFDLDAKNVVMDGMIINQSGKFLMPGIDVSQNQYIMPISLISSELFQNSSLGFFTSQYEPYFGGPTYNFAPSENYFLRTIKAVTVRIRGRIGVTTAGSYSFWIVGSSNTAINPVNYPNEPGLYYVQPAVAAGSHVFDFDITIDLPADEKLFFYTTHPFNTQDIYTDSEIFVEFKFRNDTVTKKGFTLFDLGMKLVEKMTGSAANFESSMLLTKNIILASGDSLRNIPNATIKTSWRDYWKAVDVYTKAECTITDKVRIGPRSTAYDPNKAPISLGLVKSFKVTPALDYIWTSIKVGHQDPQTDDTNGKFDFNSSMVFSTGITAIPDKQLDLQSPWKASPWEIESLMSEGKPTTDNESDNDVYALAVLPDPAGDSFESTATFNADGTPFAPGQPLVNLVAPSPVIQAGMKLRFVGSVLNTGDYTVAFATSWFFGQLITLNEPLIDESIVVTVEILEGQLYILDRTPVITQLTLPDDVDQETRDSVYNVPLSPKRIFNLHKGWIAGGCYGYAPGSIIFASNKRNKELIADGIVEKADVPIANLGDPDYIPKYMEFDTLSPVDMTETLEADPNPNMQPTWNDNNYIGYFLRGGIALNDLEEQTFKLLVTPQNNLLNLI